MHPSLRAALAPVLADLAATTDMVLEVRDSDWGSLPTQKTAMIWVDGSGCGVWVDVSESPAEQVASVADQFGDWIPEHIGGTATNWPVCPEHPTTHPMNARVVDGVASWVCPVSGGVGGVIGSLSPRSRT